MTQLSGFWTTSGTPSGHQVSGYTQAHWSQALRIAGGCSYKEGVAPSYLSELVCDAPSANTVRVATGGALVDGKWYENDDSYNVTIPSASVGYTRYDRVVVRANWGSYQATIYRIEGTESTGTPTIPSITQTPGSTYDIKLCYVLVDQSGNCTVTDERDWALAQVDDVTIQNNTGTLRVKDDGIDDLKAGNRVPQFYRRQGGSATDWSDNGDTSYTPTAVRMQGGCKPKADSSIVTVTFPQAFSYPPIVIVSPGDNSSPAFLVVDNITATTFQVQAYSSGGVATDCGVFNWLAIGPE